MSELTDSTKKKLEAFGGEVSSVWSRFTAKVKETVADAQQAINSPQRASTAPYSQSNLFCVLSISSPPQ